MDAYARPVGFTKKSTRYESPVTVCKSVDATDTLSASVCEHPRTKKMVPCVGESNSPLMKTADTLSTNAFEDPRAGLALCVGRSNSPLTSATDMPSGFVSEDPRTGLLVPRSRSPSPRLKASVTGKSLFRPVALDASIHDFGVDHVTPSQLPDSNVAEATNKNEEDTASPTRVPRFPTEREMHQHNLIQDRRWMCSRTRQTFVANRIVAWMVKSGYTRDTKTAVALGQDLLDQGKIYCVRGCFRQRFRNSKSLWRWTGSECWNLQPYERYA